MTRTKSIPTPLPARRINPVEETLVVDARAKLSPSEVVDGKLHALLSDAPLSLRPRPGARSATGGGVPTGAARGPERAPGVGNE